ncbi:heme NO-binding domain-containing protein [Cysteiniphilum marinum]|uniref:heme NO-binding domain-containing protein n=1 Tax=Cysteiniphilum marinum TaxID=2774191 RepID=UPI00193963CD|nr:heme NO-binding domain-containing protein [Cysteiniphilum marinum]
MKGLIFTSLCGFVEEKFGLIYWDKLIRETAPGSEGIYTASKTYDDAEIFSYIDYISKDKNIPVPDLLQNFGKYLFSELYDFHKTLMKNYNLFDDFIMAINDVIHFEVRKLWDNTVLPTLEAKHVDDRKIEILYRSERKLCFLAIGLIEGAAKEYNVTVKIKHPCCMHQGKDHCLIEIYKHML